MGSASAGVGQLPLMICIIRSTPWSALAEMQSTGKVPRLMTPSLRPRIISSSERVPSSKNLSMSFSSFSAAASMRAACISSALSASEAGISSTIILPPPAGNLRSFLERRSMTESKPIPALTGYCNGSTLAPKLCFSSRKVSSKLAFSWSSWLTTKTTGLCIFLVQRHCDSAPTSTPFWALMTMTAVSATLKAPITSPTKSSKPGQSIMLNLVFSNSLYSTEDWMDCCLSSSTSR